MAANSWASGLKPSVPSFPVGHIIGPVRQGEPYGLGRYRWVRPWLQQPGALVANQAWMKPIFVRLHKNYNGGVPLPMEAAPRRRAR